MHAARHPLPNLPLSRTKTHTEDVGRCSVMYTATRGTFTLTAPSSRANNLSFPLGDGEADNPLLLVGRYADVKEVCVWVYTGV